MRKTAIQIIDAYNARKSRTVGNTTVSVTPDGEAHFYLHGNEILSVRKDACDRMIVRASLAGWDTNTTRSRLNDFFAGLFGYSDNAPRVYRKNGITKIRAFNEIDDAHPNGWYFVGILPNA